METSVRIGVKRTVMMKDPDICRTSPHKTAIPIWEFRNFCDKNLSHQPAPIQSICVFLIRSIPAIALLS